MASMATPAATPGSATPSSASSLSSLERIGATAGDIWNYLNAHGPQSITKLINALDAPRDTVLQALGWLAREDKIHIDDDSRSRVVSLKQG